MNLPLSNLIANWPAPLHVRALTTSRTSGFSQHHFAANNLALHVNDEAAHVLANRQALTESLSLPHEPAWLEQTHSNICVNIDSDENRVADAAITAQYHRPLAILTADCLPILLCNQAGTEIAAIHAGWRGLANGIIEQTIDKMQSEPAQLMAWIGPAICGDCYETGSEVQQQFMQKYAYLTEFEQKNGKLHANLPHLAEQIAKHMGVASVHQSHACTFEEHERFYSYRRASETGRIATLIWLTRG
jgi:YfiH family protein